MLSASEKGRRAGALRYIMALENCTLCQGTGWKLVPRNDGTASQVAVACDCGVQDRAARVFERARIPKRYEHCDFESFVTDLTDGRSYTPEAVRSLKQAKLQAEGFVKNYPSGTEVGLLFMGRPGSGKTHLAVAALKQLIKRGHDVLFCDYGELLKTIQGSYSPENQATEMGILEPVLAAEVLVLDDLGASKPSLWTLETVGYILNKRYNDRRVTLITTNYLDGEAEAEPIRLPSGQRVPEARDTLDKRVGERIRSRLYEMCKTVTVVAPDFRKEVGKHAGRARA